MSEPDGPMSPATRRLVGVLFLVALWVSVAYSVNVWAALTLIPIGAISFAFSRYQRSRRRDAG